MNSSGGCQVIKSNEKWCRNYPMKGKVCCWSHRNLEETIAEIQVKESKKKVTFAEQPEEIKRMYSKNPSKRMRRRMKKLM